MKTLIQAEDDPAQARGVMDPSYSIHLIHPISSCMSAAGHCKWPGAGDDRAMAALAFRTVDGRHVCAMINVPIMDGIQRAQWMHWMLINQCPCFGHEQFHFKRPVWFRLKLPRAGFRVGIGALPAIALKLQLPVMIQLIAEEDTGLSLARQPLHV